MRYLRLLVLALLLLSLSLIGCQDDPEGEGSQPAISEEVTTPLPPTAIPPTATPTVTPTPPPTPTPLPPLAALVNGRPVLLADYEAELARYRQAQAELGLDPATDPDAEETVLNALIERELILAEAVAQGISVSDETLDAELAGLRTASGEAGNFDAWLAANGWTEATFREALRAELITAEMAARVTADVPTAVEQVRASYIQVDDPAVAEDVRNRAAAGDDFTFLAQQFSLDRVTGEFGGDLGFFYEGALLVPELEAVAFALQPGELSEVITVTNESGGATYYILLVTERDPARELTADGRLGRLQAAFDGWLNELLAAAQIERFPNS